MHCNNCWSFKHVFNIVQSKILPFFIKTPLVPAHFNTRHLFSRNSMPCPLTNFGQSSATLSLHSTRTSSRNPALGDVQRPRPCHQDSIRSQPTRGPMPVPSDDANANAVEPPAYTAAAPPLAPSAEAAAAPPEKPAPRTPLAKGQGR